jgi:hypothetical protein
MGRNNFLFYSKALVSLIFLVAGACKVFPFLHAEAFDYFDNTFQNSFVPLWQRLLFDLIGHKVSPVVFKYLIGNSELAVSVLLWGAGGLPVFASLFGGCLMLGAICTLLLLGENFMLPLLLEIACVVIFFLSQKNLRDGQKKHSIRNNSKLR